MLFPQLVHVTLSSPWTIQWSQNGSAPTAASVQPVVRKVRTSQMDLKQRGLMGNDRAQDMIVHTFP